MQLVHEPLESVIRRAGRRAATLASVVFLAAACTAPAGGGATNPPATTGATNPPASMAAGGLVLVVAQDATLGAHVTGKGGMSLYVFENDVSGKSNCNDQCATNWPPLTVASAADVTAEAGVTGELGTIKRADGATQVTLDGKPLYYFANDKAAGDVNGQGANDVWYLVSPAGDAVGEEDDGEASPGPGATQCSGRSCY
jgi:predicted lipoprotein with Yx(FWY)xxD motif